MDREDFKVNLVSTVRVTVYVCGQQLLRLVCLLGRFLFPKSHVHTIVRTMPAAAGRDMALWLRSFGGKVFLRSVYTHSDGNSNEVAKVASCQ